MAYYNSETIIELKSELSSITQRRVKLLHEFSDLFKLLKDERAKEYLFHGASRRLGIIEHCIYNIFFIFPLEREKLLDVEELKDVDINLHSFFINIYGFLDNLAWVVLYEKNVEIEPRDVGLFYKKTKKYFSLPFREYLESTPVKTWHETYLKNYRDTLSHRIPVYVPPKFLTPDQVSQEENISKRIDESYGLGDIVAAGMLSTECEKIGSVAPVFRHSIRESGGLVLHPQIIADFKTIEQIGEKYFEMFKVKGFV